MNNNTTTTTTKSPRDWWCERQFVYGDDNNGLSSVAEPISASTGVIMLIVFLLFPKVIGEKNNVPAIFIVVRISLVLLALGTIVFHSMSYEASVESVHVNLNYFDWLPLVMTAASMLLLYTRDFFAGTKNYIFFSLLALWILFLIFGMDSLSYNYREDHFEHWSLLLNMVLLFPPFVVLVYQTYYLNWKRTWRLWLLLSASAGLWAVNASLCERGNVWVAPFHAAYHVVVAFALVHAACLGLILGSRWELVGMLGVRYSCCQQQQPCEKKDYWMSYWLLDADGDHLFRKHNNNGRSNRSTTPF
jgi:hypothetical protein